VDMSSLILPDGVPWIDADHGKFFLFLGGGNRGSDKHEDCHFLAFIAKLSAVLTC